MFRVMRFAITSFSNEKVKYVSGLKEKKNRDKNKINARESSDFIILIFSCKNTLIIYFVNIN